jgi:hypothetical protein
MAVGGVGVRIPSVADTMRKKKTFRQIRPKLKNVDIPSKMSVSIFESFA